MSAAGWVLVVGYAVLWLHFFDFFHNGVYGGNTVLEDMLTATIWPAFVVWSAAEFVYCAVADFFTQRRA